MGRWYFLTKTNLKSPPHNKAMPMGNSKPQKPTSRKTDQARGETDADRPKKDRSPWPRRLISLAIVLILIVWALPIIVVNTPMLGWAVNRATSDLNGQVELGSASLGWFSPIEIDKIVVLDDAKKPVAEIKSVRISKTLFALAMNSSDLGTVRITEPVVQVELGSDGTTNLEKLAENYLSDPDGTADSDQPLAIDLKISDGKLIVVDQSTKTKALVEKLNVDLQMTGTLEERSTATGSGMILSSAPGASTGKFAFKMEAGQTGEGSLQIEKIGLAQFAGLLRRFLPDWKIAGQLGANVDYRWGDSGLFDSLQVGGQLKVDQLVLQNQTLGPDPVRMDQVSSRLALHREPGRTVVDEAQINSPIAYARLEGKLQLADGQIETQLDSILQQPFEISSHVDLAKTARLMPDLLHLHDQTTVNQGTLDVVLKSYPGPAGKMAYRANLKTSDLTALRKGRELVWQKPITVDLDGRQTDSGPVIDRLECKSEFLKILGEGRHGHIRASAEFDLAKLGHQLGAFIDLGPDAISGNGWLRVNWTHDVEKGPFELKSEAMVRDLHLALVKDRDWNEQNISMDAKATGQYRPKSASLRLDTAEIKMQSGIEHLTVALRSPVEGEPDRIVWPVHIEETGQLSRWVDRVHAWNMIPQWNASGGYQLASNLLVSTEQVQIENFQLGIKQFQLRGEDIQIAEPTVEVNLTGQYQIEQSRLLMNKALAKTDGLEVNIEGLLVGMPKAGPLEMAGTLRYKGTVAELQGWMPSKAGSKPGKPLGGWFSGEGHLRQVNGLTNGQLQTTVYNLTYQSDSGKQMREPEIRLNIKGNYDDSTRTVTLDTASLQSAVLAGEGKGNLKTGVDPQTVKFDGTVRYDLERLGALGRPFLGPAIIFKGQGTRPVRIEGPLDLTRVKASGGFNWNSGFLYGFQLGPGEIDANLGQGVLQFKPISMTVNKGKLNLQPLVDFRSDQPILTLKPGLLVDHVQIDPMMCNNGLKFLLPPLAGVAEANGSFSIEFEQCIIPIDNPVSGSFKGKFLVHSITVGVGPMIRELAVVLNRAAPATLKKESVIHFQMKDGKIYHEGLELIFPDMTIRSAGWVALDERRTLSTVVKMPIPPKWLKNVGGSFKTALEGQVLHVPIGGTLSKPKIDQKRLDQYSQQFIQKAASSVIQKDLNKEINKGINRLFDQLQKK
jgi:translocation and assembly module TamB